MNLHPDMFARAIIAAAGHLDKDPVEAVRDHVQKVLVPAAYGIITALGCKPSKIGPILNVDNRAIMRAQSCSASPFWKAAEAAELAVHSYLTARGAILGPTPAARRAAEDRPARQVRVAPAAKPPAPPPNADGALRDRILYVMKDGPITSVSLASLLGAKESAVAMDLSCLRYEGSIVRGAPPEAGERHAEWSLA